MTRDARAFGCPKSQKLQLYVILPVVDEKFISPDKINPAKILCSMCGLSVVQSVYGTACVCGTACVGGTASQRYSVCL